MRLQAWSLELAHFALSSIALLTGLVAALISQVTATDYVALFVVVASLTAVCGLATFAYFLFPIDRSRFLLLFTLALAILGCIELGSRAFHVNFGVSPNKSLHPTAATSSVMESQTGGG